VEYLSSTNNQSWLSWFLRGILILGFLIIIGRLAELQLIKGNYYRSLAEENRIRYVSLPAPRGKILARGGEVLVDNKKIKKEGVLPDEEIIEWERDYKLGSAAAHITGYLGEISEDEVGKVDPGCPEKGVRKLGSLTGRTGLEEQYNCILSGIDGEELIEVDIRGNKLRILGRKEPVAGKDIKTSIDFSLQEKIPQIFTEAKGAVIVTDPKGEVLALFSAPSFDPNKLIRKEDSESIKKILTNPDLPFFNRAIGGNFHPGSVFKPVVALAALELGNIDKSYIFEDQGVIKVNIYSYYNWYFTQYGRTEGKIDLIRAIARSTDTFFYTIGEMVGAKKIGDWAHKLSYGEITGIDIPGEIKGLVPTPEWKMEVKGESWFLGNTYHLSIGQGDLAVTPIEVNTATSMIASGGFLCKPQIVKNENGENGCKDIGIKKENLELVKKGMIEACSSGGTGYTFFDFTPQVACKTGTAETSTDGKTHAWFTVFAPADYPEIVATVLVEMGGEGSSVAGPMAREIMDYWKETKYK
jgi:penicillin-binding protein 2